jgi:hypothetical protein
MDGLEVARDPGAVVQLNLDVAWLESGDHVQTLRPIGPLSPIRARPMSGRVRAGRSMRLAAVTCPLPEQSLRTSRPARGLAARGRACQARGPSLTLRRCPGGWSLRLVTSGTQAYREDPPRSSPGSRGHEALASSSRWEAPVMRRTDESPRST